MKELKRNIAIVCGGDSSEHDVSMRSAQGIYSFFDKERYNVYIVDVKGQDWHVQLANDTTAQIDKNDFTFVCDGNVVEFDYAYITIHGTPGENGLMQGYVSLIYEARKYVYIETPYFIPPQPVLMALATKALAVVDVCVLLPEHADRWFVEHAARSYIDRAHDAGVRFYLYQPGINHSKLLIIDDMVCS